MTDFELFQKYFMEYRQRFGLTGYKIYFKHEPIDSFASISVNQSTMVATVRLDSKMLVKDKPFLDIKKTATHEAIHLLLWRLEDRACSRYVLEDEIYEVVEEIAYKLGELIEEE